VNEFVSLVECYMRLLRLPLGSAARQRIEPALIALRDEIARQAPGFTAEGVQTVCEHVARLLEFGGQENAGRQRR
jgi:hypothetical protein